MPRIPLVAEADMTPAQRRVFDAMASGQRKSAPIGPLAIAMHRPDLAQTMSDLGLVLRFNSTFEARLREFAILLTGRHWTASSNGPRTRRRRARPACPRPRSKPCATAVRRSRRRTSRRSTITGPSC